MADKVLVIGGGIAGISLSLCLAESGIPVTLVEENPSIGGRMIQLDKTFPTLDCSSCILTPKMAEVSMNPLIRLLTLSTVVGARKEKEGDFSVTIRSLPRYVDQKGCTACGLCSEVCALKGRIEDEFNMKLGRRAAIYIPFPQAVPQKYLIDGKNCLLLSRGKCTKRCMEVCESKAIDFDDSERVFEDRFGAVVIATGFDLFDAGSIPEFGYGTYPEVITSLEFERILSAVGPTSGEILINGKRPKRFYFIQCVGSRDRLRGKRYCSRVCCMYTAKHAYMVKERIKDAQVYVSYIDVRAYGKGYEEFYKSVQEKGVIYIKGIPGEISKKGDSLTVRVEDMLSGEILEIEVDAVILACGLVPRSVNSFLAREFSLDLDEYGFIATDSNERGITSNPGVFACGVALGPKDISDTVSEAHSVASKVIEYLVGRA